MLELLQWFALVLLGVAFGWLLWRKRDERLPEWLDDFSREEFVTRSELDQFHHRVIQLSQTNRDLIHTKFEEISCRLGATGARCLDDLPQTGDKPENQEVRFETFAQKEIADALFMGTASSETDLPDVEASPCEPTPSSDRSVGEETFQATAPPEREPVPQDEEVLSPMDDVVRFWNEGMSIDQIARELRMGRQEVQLLIQMSRRSHVTRPGV